MDIKSILSDFQYIENLKLGNCLADFIYES